MVGSPFSWREGTEGVAGKHVVVAAIIFSVVGVYLRWPVMAVKTPSDIRNFPVEVGAWYGSPELVPVEEFTQLGAEGLVSMKYRSGEKASIDFYLAYFEFQTQTKELAGDRVERFLIGDIPVEQGQAPAGGLQVRRIIQQRGDGYQVILSWYEVDGHSIASVWKVVLQSMYGSLVYRRNNGALVVITMDYSKSTDLPRTMEQLDDFVRAIVPSVKSVLSSTGKSWL
ncbi:MAG TPA: EpsI family protein [Nitrospira sp.]|nr:EpsI family protein [Nitrospira sp.]